MPARRLTAPATGPIEDPAERRARRRRLLLARSARLREELAADAAVLARRVGRAQQGAVMLRSRLGPALLAVGLLAVLAVLIGRPSRLLRWTGKAVALWPVVRPFARPALLRLLPVLATALRRSARPTRATPSRFDPG